LASFLKSPSRRVEKAWLLSRAGWAESRFFCRFNCVFKGVRYFFDQKNGEKSVFSDQITRRIGRLDFLTFHFIEKAYLEQAQSQLG